AQGVSSIDEVAPSIWRGPSRLLPFIGVAGGVVAGALVGGGPAIVLYGMIWLYLALLVRCFAERSLLVMVGASVFGWGFSILGGLFILLPFHKWIGALSAGVMGVLAGGWLGAQGRDIYGW
ncbi:MAG: hypothetical protein AB1665_03190, partial [Candidatus Thermoplasmatota archaeon]